MQRVLRKERKERGWTQSELAARANVDVVQVSRAEIHGYAYPKPLERIAAALDWHGKPDELLREGGLMLAVQQQEQQPAKVVYLSDTPPARVEMLASYPDLLTPAHVSELTGLCAHTVRDLCRRGELPAVKIAARWFVPKNKFLDFLEGMK